MIVDAARLRAYATTHCEQLQRLACAALVQVSTSVYSSVTRLEAPRRSAQRDQETHQALD